MQTQRTFIDDLKHQYKHGGMFMRLIFINVMTFLVINIVLVFGELMGKSTGVQSVIGNIFSLETDLRGFIRHPWALFTSIFAHYGFLHILLNMVFLFFAGKHFEQIFGGRRLLYTYILGGVAGGLLEIIAHLAFPLLQETSVVVVGASGSIMAIFMAIAFYQPNLQVRLFGLSPFKLIWIAVAYIVLDVIKLASNDGTAHFAHIGGIIVGIISIQRIQSSGNLITFFMRLGDFVSAMFSRNKKAKLTVVRGDKVRKMTDEEYNENAKARQDETNRILDKISKSGYESLNKREKDFLFNQSKNG